MWMDREIQAADFVVLVCTDVYRMRVEGRDAPLKGRGVLWEAKLIYNHLYQTDTVVQRFVPILMEGAVPSDIPWPIRGLTYYQVDTAEGYDELYRHVAGQLRLEKPALGTRKALPSIEPHSYPASPDARTGAVTPTSLDLRNRAQMLKRVRLDWIDGILNRSLYQVARIELDLESKGDAVDQPLNAIVQVPDSPPLPIPSATDISQVFDAHASSLLILGGPGTGKTTLLLQLAQELLNRAGRDPGYPIPVVFNLSSWATRRQPLAQWLVAELNARSDVPKGVALRWVETEQIIPLLDGLDEVAEEHRQACVEAINTFRRGYGLVPIAVCSRIADYEALGRKLRLRTAVVVQPLTRQQVNAYLERIGEPLHSLRAALNEDSSLGELLETPLMLWVAMLAYRHGPGGSPLEGTLEQRRRQLLASFVDAMFKRRSPAIAYERGRTIHWLACLASALTRNNETVFRLENLRPGWAPTRMQRSLARAGTVAASGLAGGPILGLAHALITTLLITLLSLRHATLTWVSSLLGVNVQFGIDFALTYWLSPALCIGLLGAFMDLRPTETMRITVAGVSSRLGRASRTGLLLGLTAWLGLCPLAISASGEATKAMMASPNFAVFVSLGFPEILMRWSLTRFLILAVGFGLFVAPVAGLLAGVLALLSGEAVEARVTPNQGTHRSVKAAVSTALTLGLCGALLGLLVSRPLVRAGGGVDWRGLIIGLHYGLSCGLIAGMVAGGLFSLRHFVMRLSFWINGQAPLDYARFLDWAAERLFLRKVGGGYVFTHRMLTEYFAELTEPAK